MEVEELKAKLKRYSEKDIIVTPHAEIQATVREVKIEEVKNNIMNPEKLVFVEEQEAIRPDEKKLNCYFAYSKDLSHRYVFTVNGKIIIVTIIKINRDWQRIIDKK